MTLEQSETISTVIKQMQDFVDMHDPDRYLIEIRRDRIQRWISRLEEVEGCI